MRHPGRKHVADALLTVTGEELHRAAEGRRFWPRVMQSHRHEPADDIVPLRLPAVRMPGLQHSFIHKGVAELAERGREERVAYPNDFPEEPPLVGMSDQAAYDYTFNHQLSA